MLKTTMNMRTFKWLLLLVVNIIQCTSAFISGGTFQINKRMNGHVIHILSNMGAKMCVRHCNRYKDCNAVNYSPPLLECQLLAVTADGDNLIVDSEYMYADMTNWKMNTDSCWPNNPCKEDTRCLPTDSNSHACLTFGSQFRSAVIEFTPCTANPCIYGYCSITNVGYNCTCDAGYSGNNCGSSDNPCLPDPCGSGYTCIVCKGGNSHRCSFFPRRTC